MKAWKWGRRLVNPSSKKDSRFIEIGKNEGARLVIGGDAPKGEEFGMGYYVNPTIFSDVTPDMEIAQKDTSARYSP